MSPDPPQHKESWKYKRNLRFGNYVNIISTSVSRIELNEIRLHVGIDLISTGLLLSAAPGLLPDGHAKKKKIKYQFQPFVLLQFFIQPL